MDREVSRLILSTSMNAALIDPTQREFNHSVGAMLYCWTCGKSIQNLCEESLEEKTRVEVAEVAISHGWHGTWHGPCCPDCTPKTNPEWMILGNENSDAGFLTDIFRNPSNPALRCTYTEWLAGCHDPRASFVRQYVEMPPIGLLALFHSRFPEKADGTFILAGDHNEDCFMAHRFFPDGTVWRSSSVDHGCELRLLYDAMIPVEADLGRIFVGAYSLKWCELSTRASPLHIEFSFSCSSPASGAVRIVKHLERDMGPICFKQRGDWDRYCGSKDYWIDIKSVVVEDQQHRQWVTALAENDQMRIDRAIVEFAEAFHLEGENESEREPIERPMTAQCRLRIQIDKTFPDGTIPALLARVSASDKPVHTAAKRILLAVGPTTLPGLVERAGNSQLHRDHRRETFRLINEMLQAHRSVDSIGCRLRWSRGGIIDFDALLSLACEFVQEPLLVETAVEVYEFLEAVARGRHYSVTLVLEARVNAELGESCYVGEERFVDACRDAMTQIGEPATCLSQFIADRRPDTRPASEAHCP